MEKLFYVCAYLMLLYVQGERYIYLLPTIPVYPDNREESQIVKAYTERQDAHYLRRFRETDESVAHAFDKLVKDDLETLVRIITRPHVLVVIMSLKIIINRARPAQVDPTLRAMPSLTAQTPAFPSGHAFQAYYLAKVLSDRYPERRREFNLLAEECALSRVYAGLHYPSDNRFSKWIVDHLM